MKRMVRAILAILLVLWAWNALAADPLAMNVEGLPEIKHFQIQDYSEDYQPSGFCDKRIAALVDTATHTVFVQAYQFQSKTLQDSLIRAGQRGVSVRLLLDKTQRPAEGKPDKINSKGLLTSGVIIKIDRQPPIAHNKRVIVDGQIVVGGSFNYSDHALKNAENCDFAVSSDLARQAVAYFTTRWGLPNTTNW